MFQTDSYSVFEDLTGEGTLPLYGLRFVVFVDKEGNRELRTCVHGQPDVETVLGSLDIVKATMVYQYVQEDDG